MNQMIFEFRPSSVKDFFFIGLGIAAGLCFTVHRYNAKYMM